MRTTTYFLIGWMLLQGKSLVAQDRWGDYYFINQQYVKAVIDYQRDSVNLSLVQQRNFAQSLWALHQKTAALRAYTPVANSNEALVEDYYRYADLLKGQEALARNTGKRPIACRGKPLRCGPMTVCFSKSDFGRILTALKRRSSIPQEMSLVPNQLLWMDKSGFYLWPISSL